MNYTWILQEHYVIKIVFTHVTNVLVGKNVPGSRAKTGRVEMVVSCCAYGCMNWFGAGPALGCYRFPAKPNWRNRWIIAVHRKYWNPIKHSRISAAHFIKNDEKTNFYTGLPSRAVFMLVYLFLVEHMPTIKLYKTNSC